MSNIDNYEDVIDSRDVIARIEELESAKLAALESDGEPLDDDEEEELAILRAFAEEASSYAEDWPHGVALIRESYFVEYAREYADDIGAMKETEWPYRHIDWDAAAEELQMDYTSIDYDGVTYYVR